MTSTSGVLLSLVFILSGFQRANSAKNMATYIFMDITRSDTSDSVRLCANFHPDLIKVPFPARSLQDATPYGLAYYDDLPCNAPNASLHGKLVHTYSQFDSRFGVRLDRCEETKMNVNDKISLLQSYNSSAILFLTAPYRTHASFYDPRVNDSIVSVPIYYIDGGIEKIFSKFVKRPMQEAYILRFFIPKDPVVDVAMLIVLLISMICVAVGGAWSGQKHYELYRAEANKRLLLCSHETPSPPVDGREEGDQSKSTQTAWAETSASLEAEPAAAPFNWITLFLFVVIVVGFLMLLYFAYPVVVWLTIVIYVIASSSAMCTCLWYFVQKIPKGKCAFQLDPLADCLTRICRCCSWSMFRVSVQYRHAALYFACLAVGITWCIFRHWSYSYILHDILAMCFAIVTIRNLRMSNLKWITCLLSLLLIYDLFMVFITPYMTKSLPIVIRVPRFNDPLWSCYRMDVDMQYPPVILGLGDIILPGILVGYNAAFSLASKTPFRLYYVASLVGYCVGMVCTFVALLLSRLPQPALIYLVPSVLIPTHLIAVARKEWMKMWKGLFPLIEESCPILKSPNVTEQAPATGQLLDPASGTAAIRRSDGISAA